MSNYFKLSITDNFNLVELHNIEGKIVFNYKFENSEKMQDFIDNKKSSAFEVAGPLLKINIIECMEKLKTSYFDLVIDPLALWKCISCLS